MKLFEIINEKPELVNEGAFTDFMTKTLGRNFSKTIGSSVETLLQKSIDDIARGGGKVSLKSLKNSQAYKDALLKAVGEASRVKFGKKFNEVLSSSSKSEAEILAKQVQNGLDEELKSIAARAGKLADDDLKAAQKNVKKTSNKITKGKSTKTELSAATKNLKINQKLQGRFDEIKKVVAGMDQKSATQIANMLKKEAKVVTDTGANVSTKVAGDVTISKGGKLFNITKEQLKQFPGKIKHVIVTNKVKSILAGLGLGALALYLIYGDDTIVTDENGKPIDDNQNLSQWGPCLTTLLSNNQARVATTPKGSVVVIAPPSEKYPKGVQFYSNGRALNLQTMDKGSWTCSEGGIVKESNLDEQVDTQLATDVNDLIDYLDFPVYGNDLQNAYNILLRYSKNGKGKQLLRNYTRTDNEDLRSVVMSLSMKMRDDESGQLIDAIVKLYDNIMGNTTADSSQQQNKRTVTINEQESKIDIVWDKDKKSNDGSNPKPDGDDGKTNVTDTLKPKKQRYHKCEDFPFQFGCKSPLIGEIQKCIGVSPTHGNFGPWTRKALQDLKHDVSNGITKELYDTIMKNCGQETIERTKIEPIVTAKKELNLVGLVDKIKTPELKLQTIKTDPDAFYKALVKAGFIGEVPEDGDGKTRIKYKGPDLDDEQLSNLDTSMSGMGYDRIKQLEKDYGSKYVYLKRD